MRLRRGSRVQLRFARSKVQISFMEDDFQSILENGITFGRGGGKPKTDADKVKTKAKKKAYITGTHGSGSARQKAKYRQQRANRHKK